MADYCSPPVNMLISEPTSTNILPTIAFAPDTSTPRDWTDGDRLVTVYYLHFHQAHPFLPPHDALSQFFPPNYLLDVMQFIGMHYISSHSVPDCSSQLLAAVQEADLSVEKVQAFLLLSIILHARMQPKDAKECMNKAVYYSLELGLHDRQFSDALEMQSPVRAESARRTWWEVFITDTLLAAVQVEGSLQFIMETPDVPLPCEETEYHDGRLAGVSPSARDLDGQALFHRDGDFSSFAYRVEAAIILRKCLVASEDRISQESMDVLDATISSWFHRVPKRSRATLRNNGEVDQMAFQAYMIMHCTSVYLHFPKSYLVAFLPTTSQLFCARPPDLSSTSWGSDSQVHTAKVVAAAVNMSKLASLSTSVINHSPFFACILVLSSIVQLAILSAGPQQSSGTDRQYLALNIGVLGSMGDIWAIAATSMGRIRDVAMEIEAGARGLRDNQMIQPV